MLQMVFIISIAYSVRYHDEMLHFLYIREFLLEHDIVLPFRGDHVDNYLETEVIPKMDCQISNCSIPILS